MYSLKSFDNENGVAVMALASEAIALFFPYRYLGPLRWASPDLTEGG